MFQCTGTSIHHVHTELLLEWDGAHKMKCRRKHLGAQLGHVRQCWAFNQTRLFLGCGMACGRWRSRGSMLCWAGEWSLWYSRGVRSHLVMSKTVLFSVLWDWTSKRNFLYLFNIKLFFITSLLMVCILPVFFLKADTIFVFWQLQVSFLTCHITWYFLLQLNISVFPLREPACW